MNPVTPVQPSGSGSVTASVLLSHTHIHQHWNISYIQREPQCRVQSIVNASPVMLFYFIIVVGSCGNYPFCSFPLLSALLFHPSCSLWTPCPTYAVLQSHTHTQTVLWRSFRSTLVWNIQLCWIRELREEISLASFGGHKCPSHMDIHTVLLILVHVC